MFTNQYTSVKYNTINEGRTNLLWYQGHQTKGFTFDNAMNYATKIFLVSGETEHSRIETEYKAC